MKQKVFADTNVMVDLLAHRVPFYEAAMRLFSLADRGECTIVVSALSFSTTAYLLERKLNYEDLSLVLRQFASIVEIASVDERTVRKSLSNTDGLSLPKRATEKHAGKTASSQPKTNTYREFHIKH